MRRFVILLLLIGCVVPGVAVVASDAPELGSAPPPGGARTFDGVWYRTPEKRGKVAAWLASGSLTVGRDAISFESKKISVNIAAKSVRRVVSGQLPDDPVNVWVIVEYDEGGTTQAAAFKDAGMGGDTPAIQTAIQASVRTATITTATGAPPSWGDVVHDVCAEVETKKFQDQGQKQDSELMAHLVCQVAAAGCRDDPGQDACKKTLRELDAHLREAGSSMLYAAAHGGRTDICRTMLGLGSDINAAVATGWTPLMAAAAGGHAETVAALLGGGADPTAQDKSGKTALSLAEAGGHSEAVRLLEASDLNRTGTPR